MNATRRFGLLIALAVFLLDQAIKYLVTGPLALDQVGQIVLLPIFNLTWVQNYGVSMGFLTADSETTRWALVALTAAIGTGVLVWLWREHNRHDVIALGLVLGGAAGNILDRVRFGYVVDFLDLHIGEFRPFLVFNVADAAITIGVLILLLRALFARQKSEPAENVNA
ncbi:signal peptidase II [Sphingomonas sp. ID1715]|uniref:signal peptidase II n=1 Tax=Sphingomonas sp. ID1715 TaxID=1656898 RepID=UPI00148818B5|nr:signal peptidase II [Sphingomonas sp. ID1715]NNM77363.1 signal peptidase II [Sphingomonas sp. ID1715]